MKHHHRPLKMKLFTLFALSIGIPLVVLSLILSFYFNQILIKESRLLFNNTLYCVSTNLQMYLDDLNRVSLAPHLYSDIMAPMHFINDGHYTNVTDPLACFTMHRRYSFTIQKMLVSSRDDILGVLFMPINNPGATAYLNSRASQTIQDIDTYDFMAEPWYQEVIRLNGKALFCPPHEVPYYSTTSTRNVFSVVRLIRDIDHNQSVGIFKVDASDKVIKNIFDNITLDTNSHLILLDENMDIIYSKNSLSSELVNKITTLATPILHTANDTYYVSTATLPKFPWKLVYLASKKDVLIKTNAIYYVVGLLGMVSLAIAYFIFHLRSDKLVDPVKNIIHTMQQAEEGDLSVKIHIDESINDEYIHISEAFNHMIDQLNSHIDNEYKAVLSKRNAEYLALQAQINPHFLYNTLNNFITLNRIGDQKVLENSIIHLTNFFRYSCTNENLSTLEQEFLFLENYLTLQHLRFDERLTFSLHNDKTVQNFPIPKFLLQPLVENAIIHGMEPSDQSIHLEVYTYPLSLSLLGPCVIISIHDNGLGFDVGTLKNNSRVGLKNIIERLEWFSPHSFFEIISSPQHGTCCHILLPIKEVSHHANLTCR